jgi:hypothetical protein
LFNTSLKRFGYSVEGSLDFLGLEEGKVSTGELAHNFEAFIDSTEGFVVFFNSSFIIFVGLFSFGGDSGDVIVVIVNFLMEISEVFLELRKSGVEDVVEDVFSVGDLDFSIGDLSFESGDFRLILEGSFVIGNIVFFDFFIDIFNEGFDSFNEVFNGSLGHNVEFS